MKDTKGITLVVLIVTIIVLLIVAGVTISTLKNVGLLEKSQKAMYESKKEREIEALSIIKTEILMEKEMKGNLEEDLSEDIRKKIEGKGLKAGVTKDEEDINKYMIVFEDTNNIYYFYIDGRKVELIGQYDESKDNIELIQADIEFIFIPSDWTSSEVKTEVRVKKDISSGNFVLQVSKDGEKWETYTEGLTSTENDKVYARVRNTVTGQIKAEAIGNVINIDKVKPEVTEVTATTKNITIKAKDTASGVSGYAITEDTTQPTDFVEVSNTKEIEVTSEKEYEQGKRYYVWVKDKVGNVSEQTEKSTIVTERVTDLNKDTTELQQANVSFSYKNVKDQGTGWTNGDVIVTASTTVKGYVLKTSTDGINWDNSTSQTLKTNKEKIYAVLTDGKNYGGAAAFSVTNIDKLQPNSFTPTVQSTTKSLKVTASTTDKDATEEYGKSNGIQYRFSKDNGSTYTNYQTSGEYTWNDLTQTTTFNIKVEAKDAAGNVTTESISKGTGTVETASGGDYSPKTWTNGNVTVTLPTKSGYTTLYTTNGVAPTKDSTRYTSAFTVSANSTINYIYSDGKNIGGAGTLNVTNIDKTLPSIGAATGVTIISGNTGYKVTFSSLSDTGGSGLSAIFIKKDDSSAPTASTSGWISNTASSYQYNVTAAGTYYAWVKDAAGNVSGSKNCTVSVLSPKYEISLGSPKYHTTLQSALNACSNYGTITVLENDTDSSLVSFDGKLVGLALNGKTICNRILIKSKATLKVSGTGTLKDTTNGLSNNIQIEGYLDMRRYVPITYNYMFDRWQLTTLDTTPRWWSSKLGKR